MWHAAKTILGLCIYDNKSRWSFAFVPQGRGVQNSEPLPADWHTLGGESRQGKYPDLGTPTTARVSNFFMRANQGYGDRFSGYEKETLT